MVDIKISNNSFAYNDYGIYAEDASKRATVIGNIFYSNRIESINIGKGEESGDAMVLVAANQFFGNPGSTAIICNGNYYNIYGNQFINISGGGFESCIKVTDVDVYDTNISNNTFQGNYGILVETDFQHSSISNNVFFSRNPIKIKASATNTRNLRIINNTINLVNSTGSVTPTENALIQIDRPGSYFQRLMISNNNITGNGSVYAIEVDANYVMITNNLFYDTLGIHNLSSTSTDAIIKDNLSK